MGRPVYNIIAAAAENHTVAVAFLAIQRRASALDFGLTGYHHFCVANRRMERPAINGREVSAAGRAILRAICAWNFCITADLHIRITADNSAFFPRVGRNCVIVVITAEHGDVVITAAVDALERNEVRRIILTRPAVEAGEKLGFLPGDLSQKVDPYLRPLYDALFEMLGFEKVEKFIERQIIEIAPLAYMRGRTLNDSFIILDEAQNTTIEQMKMFLTRIGFNSKAVITGDPSQIDLPKHIKSGLKHALEVLKDVDSIGFSFFESGDVVRHPVVAAIVNAYELYDKKEEERKKAYRELKDKENNDLTKDNGI